ncbi:olfactory receptor 13F1-like [Discoglossus pictus]
MYLISVLGNLSIASLICGVPQLHTPMYIFLCNLSAQDIVYVSAILPKLLAITITGDNRISFSGCITQLFLFILCIGTEFFLLTAMAYDRYVAICIPLRYYLIMDKGTCSLMATTSWLVSAFNSMMFSLLMSRLSFCNAQDINHFYCDLTIMLKLSCSDIRKISDLIFLDGIFLGCFPFAVILTSYMYIISTIIKMRSSAGRVKAFSSCSSHLVVVSLFCVTALSLNMKPESKPGSEELNKLLSILYIGVVPVLNPIVYSLRNREVLKAMKKVAAQLTYKG